jgi:putative hydrolase of the HAD superfamily
MPKVETVLLDAGGVLLDLDYAFVRRLLEARHASVPVEDLSLAEAYARTLVDDRVRNGGTSAEAWRDYFRVILTRVGVAPEKTDEIIDVLWEAHLRVGLWTVPIAGAVDTVRRLRGAGYRIGVVSNAEGRVENDLAVAGFEGLLDTVIDSHVVGVAKPDPKIFLLALERLGGSPETAIFLGDVPSVDVVGARAAGVFPILLDRHGLYPTADAPRLRAIEELPDYLAAGA